MQADSGIVPRRNLGGQHCANLWKLSLAPHVIICSGSSKGCGFPRPSPNSAARVVALVFLWVSHDFPLFLLGLDHGSRAFGTGLGSGLGIGSANSRATSGLLGGPRASSWFWRWPAQALEI